MMINPSGVIIEYPQGFANIQQSVVSPDYAAFLDGQGIWVHIPKELVKSLYNTLIATNQI